MNSVYETRLGRYWLFVGTKVIVYQSVLVLSGSSGIVKRALMVQTALPLIQLISPTGALPEHSCGPCESPLGVTMLAYHVTVRTPASPPLGGSVGSDIGWVVAAMTSRLGGNWYPGGVGGGVPSVGHPDKQALKTGPKRVCQEGPHSPNISAYPVLISVENSCGPVVVVLSGGSEAEGAVGLLVLLVVEVGGTAVGRGAGRPEVSLDWLVVVESSGGLVVTVRPDDGTANEGVELRFTATRAGFFACSVIDVARRCIEAAA